MNKKLQCKNSTWRHIKVETGGRLGTILDYNKRPEKIMTAHVWIGEKIGTHMGLVLGWKNNGIHTHCDFSHTEWDTQRDPLGKHHALLYHELHNRNSIIERREPNLYGVRDAIGTATHAPGMYQQKRSIYNCSKRFWLQDTWTRGKRSLVDKL